MSNKVGSSSLRKFLSEFSNLPAGIKRVSTALLLLIAIVFSAAVFGYVDLRMVNERQQQLIDQLADDLSFVESEVSSAENSIEWLQSDVEELTNRLDTLCRILRISYLC
jgi:hypothetical protein